MEPPAHIRASSPALEQRHRLSSASQNYDPQNFGGPYNEGRYTSQGPYQPSSMEGNLTKMVWEAGSKQVQQAFILYTNIDLFRPYFDVDPKQLRNRLFCSFLPRKPSTMQQSNYDLYGPMMLIFTMVALLLFSMKSSGYIVEDGTLIGSAIFTCFGYWTLTSIGLYFLGYMFRSDLSLIQLFSVMGYALFGHCLVILLSAIFHPAHSHMFFYALVLVFAGPSSARLAVIFASRTPDKTHKLVLGFTSVFCHVAFLFYLHFGYHKMVTEIDTILGGSEGHLTPNLE